MRKLTLAFCVLLLTIACCGIASAAVPHLINYQGRLIDTKVLRIFFQI